MGACCEGGRLPEIAVEDHRRSRAVVAWQGEVMGEGGDAVCWVFCGERGRRGRGYIHCKGLGKECCKENTITAASGLPADGSKCRVRGVANAGACPALRHLSIQYRSTCTGPTKVRRQAHNISTRNLHLHVRHGREISAKHSANFHAALPSACDDKQTDLLSKLTSRRHSQRRRFS